MPKNRQTNPVVRPLAKAFSLRLATCLAATATLATTSQIHAQAAATGVITGRVQNATNGQYLNNAKISVVGTNTEVFTDSYGEFQLNDIPAGTIKLRVFFTGLETKEINVTVNAGEILSKEISLTASQVASGTGEGDTIILDQFVVAQQREFNAANIAANEERFAPSIRSVVDAGAFGDVAEGNVGEFIKYLPGVAVDYVAADVRTISVRGFAPQFTNVFQDGMRMTSSNSGATGRQFELEQVSINNAQRIEVTKVPTPDSSAASLGGNVNMISKSAFERPRAEFKYRASINFNSEDTDPFKKTAGPGSKNTYKVLPGFDFDLTLPFSKTFGIIVTGLTSNQFNEQHRTAMTWATKSSIAALGVSDYNPIFTGYSMQDGPKNSFRDSFSIKADWKFLPHHVLTVGTQTSYYKSFFGNRNVSIGSTLSAASTFGENFTNGVLGTSNPSMGTSYRDKLGRTSAVNVMHRYNGRLWEFESGANAITSKTWYRDMTRGHFDQLNLRFVSASTRTQFSGLSYPKPGTITVTDASGNVVDPFDLNNYRVNTANSRPIDGQASLKSAFFNVKRGLDFLPFEANVKVGSRIEREVKDNRSYGGGISYTFVGADKTANTADDNAMQFVDPNYVNQDNIHGWPVSKWISPYLLKKAYDEHPDWFTTNAVTNESLRIQNSERVQETITAGFVQFDGKLFRNKLSFVTGVRFEKTQDSGEGSFFNPDAVWQRNAAGQYIDASGNPVTSASQRVRKPQAGTAGSMEELRFLRKERAALASRSYDNFFPSLHLNYSATDNVIVRFAYAKTIGRPDYNIIVPNTTVDENDIDPALPGNLTVRNTRLKPWLANNFDVTTEYYFTQGGKAAVGVFRKDLSNFWGTFNGQLTTQAMADELDVDFSKYANWNVSTRRNVGSARITGFEFNFEQQLKMISGWGKYFKVMGNATTLHLQGANGADFSNFIPRSANLGLSFNKKPVNVQLKWNYRGRQKRALQSSSSFQDGTYEYYASRYNIDVNFEYMFSKRVAFFLNGRNILNKPQDLQRYNATSMPYSHFVQSEEYGIQWTLGVKGSF